MRNGQGEELRHGLGRESGRSIGRGGAPVVPDHDGALLPQRFHELDLRVRREGDPGVGVAARDRGREVAAQKWADGAVALGGDERANDGPRCGRCPGTRGGGAPAAPGPLPGRRSEGRWPRRNGASSMAPVSLGTRPTLGPTIDVAHTGALSGQRAFARPPRRDCAAPHPVKEPPNESGESKSPSPPSTRATRAPRSSSVAQPPSGSSERLESQPSCHDPAAPKRSTPC